MKKFISCLILSVMMCGSFTSCSESENIPVAADIDDVELEDSIAAESGDAYLAIVDGQWRVQYWGKNDNPATAMHLIFVQIIHRRSYLLTISAHGRQLK